MTIKDSGGPAFPHTETMIDGGLHEIARNAAESLRDPDRKQLRFNDIVRVAKLFYNDPSAGVCELVAACDRMEKQMYVAKRPMWHALEAEYRWMLQ